MLYALDKARILSLLTSKAKNYKSLSKPDKIFLGNTNLMHALCPSVDKGNERETYFNSQLSVLHVAKCPDKGDFLIDDKYLFEVGGRKRPSTRLPTYHRAISPWPTPRQDTATVFRYGFSASHTEPPSLRQSSL